MPQLFTFALVTGLAHLLTAVMVFRDASSTGRNAPAWALAALVGGVVGAGAYLVTR